MPRTDPLSKAERSRLMSKIRGKHTKPEMFVRRLVRSLGHGYRLHRRDLPGCPDLVFQQAAHPAGPAERRVSDQRDARLGAALDEPTSKSSVIQQAEGDLDSGDGGEVEGLIELPEVDVRQPHALHHQAGPSQHLPLTVGPVPGEVCFGIVAHRGRGQRL